MVTLLTVAVAGCGGNSSGTQAPAVARKTISLAQICAAHPRALGGIDGAMVTFKLAMGMGTMKAWAASASGVSDQAELIENAAARASVPFTPAVRTYMQDLDDLVNATVNPPKFPTAVAGNQDYAKWQADGKAVGC